MYESSNIDREGSEELKRDRSARSGAVGKPLGIALSILSALIGLILLAWTILFVTKGRFLKPHFERIVSDQSGRRVDVAGDFQLYFNPINIKFRAEGLTVSNPSWASRPNFFESRLIDTSIATFPLIFGNQRINWLNLAEGNVNLEWDSTGRRNTWTFGDPNAPAKPFEMPVIRRALVSGTKIRFRAPQMQILADINIDTVRAADTKFASDIRFSGGGTARGRAFTLSGSLMSPNETLAGGRNQLALRAGAGGHVVTLAGTLAGATELEGADLKLTANGPNLQTLFDMIGVLTPETRRYRFSSNLTKAGDEWRFRRMAGVFGDSDFGGSATISMPRGRMTVRADIASKVLDIIDVGPWVGYSPEKLDKQGAGAAITTDAGRPRVLPDAPLRVDMLKQFDAHVNYKVTTVRMENFPISNIGLTLDLDRSLLKLSPLTFDLSGGHLASDIIINARAPAVITDYDIRLSPTPMGRLLGKFGAEQSGTTGTLKARIKMRGVGDSVRRSLASSNGRIAIIMPAGTFWTRNTELAELDIGTFVQKMFEKKLEEPVQINCGLIAFTVRDGIAAADPILIDTKKNVIGGRGGFSFKTESLDMAIEADSKRFSLFSAQSPIGVGGYFAAPAIDPISGELLARAGAGIGLTALLSPLAGVVAFVDPGDAEPTRCGPVLAGARAAYQRERDGGKVEEIGDGKSADPDAKPNAKKKKFLGIF